MRLIEERNGVIKPVAPNKGHWLYFFLFAMAVQVESPP